MRRLIVLLVVGMLVAACGGGDSGDDGADTTADQPDTTQAESNDGTDAAPATTQPAEDDSGESNDSGGDDTADAGDEGEGPSTATVTLGGETYEFSTEGAIVAQCLTDLFGIFSVQLPRLDGDGGVSIVALREGTDPDVVGEVNSVEVDLGDEDWVADEADMMFEQSDLLEPGMSQVDSVQIEGRTVSGTATFYRSNSLFAGGDVETATGTFEATCGEERTS